MISATRKKVIVRDHGGGVRCGYLAMEGQVVEGFLELLDLEGRIAAVPLAEVRYVAYVRDFNQGEEEPERLTRRTFLARPRGEGLWVSLTLRGGETLEGLAATDLALADGWMRDGGIYVVPPDVRSNTQRVFVPRLAVVAMEVLGVITSPRRAGRVAKTSEREELQKLLFPGG